MDWGAEETSCGATQHSPSQDLLWRHADHLGHHSETSEPHTPEINTHVLHRFSETDFFAQGDFEQLTFKYLICPRLSAMETAQMAHWV